MFKQLGHAATSRASCCWHAQSLAHAAFVDEHCEVWQLFKIPDGVVGVVDGTDIVEQPDHHMHVLPSESVVMAQAELFVGEKQGDCAK